jgi:NAD(P)-dependent dehydrogenase (short-subunit alcohol dehydrogenase family)
MPLVPVLWTVAVTDINLDLARQVAAVAGGAPHSEALQLDATDRARIDATVEDLLARHGRIDALVNAAGGMRGLGIPKTDFAAMTPQVWNRLLDNFQSMLHCACSPARDDRRAPWCYREHCCKPWPWGPQASIYSAAKAAIIVFSQSLAQEVAARHPGQHHRARHAQARWKSPRMRRAALGRHNRRDVGRAVAFLLSRTPPTPRARARRRAERRYINVAGGAGIALDLPKGRQSLRAPVCGELEETLMLPRVALAQMLLPPPRSGAHRRSSRPGGHRERHFAPHVRSRPIAARKWVFTSTAPWRRPGQVGRNRVVLSHGATTRHRRLRAQLQDYSWMDFLARAGFDVWAMDLAAMALAAPDDGRPCNVDLNQQETIIKAATVDVHSHYQLKFKTSRDDWAEIGRPSTSSARPPARGSIVTGRPAARAQAACGAASRQGQPHRSLPGGQRAASRWMARSTQ